MCCAERVRREPRFPLEIRAGRTPGATALVWRADALTASLPPSGHKGGAVHGPPGGRSERGVGGPATAGDLTFAQLEQLTRLAAQALLARGVAPAERVAILLPPGPAYVVALLALLRAGCVAAPLSTRLPAGALPELLGRVGCRRLIASRKEGAAAGIEVLDPGVLEFPAAWPRTPSIPRSERGNGQRELASRGDTAGLPPFDAAAPATVVFTSGSTGAPKAALHSFASHWASAVGANRNLPLRPGDRWLLSLPLWHVGGLAVVFRCLQGGAAVAIAGKEEPLADAIPALGVTHLSLVATQLRRLLGDPRGREALRSLKGVLLGGGPLSAPLIEEAAALGVPLVTSYGSTETCSQAAATRPGEPLPALRTAGRALSFREVAIGAGGEILVRGRTLFLGYLDGETLRTARDADGWFHTGDLGRLDEGGRLVVEGRRDNMFISGGENVHPEEIERALTGCPGLLEALVVPLPDAEFGARPAAFVRTAGGDVPDPAALGACLRRTLPGFKVPVRYFPWPRLEEGMKPDRTAFAALARGQVAAAE